jgi:hypothetical protein
MSKYDALGAFLRRHGRLEIAMSFADIERIAGTKLPAKSQASRAWWSNNPNNNVMTKVWLAAGYRSEQVDLRRKRVVFRRRLAQEIGTTGMSDQQRPFAAKAGAGRHPAIGALKGTFTIAPGTDLTKPAWPEWADYLDEKYGPEAET